MLYLDSSALVKLVVVEAESASLGSYLRAFSGRRASSALARVEVPRAVRAEGNWAVISARTLLGKFDLLAMPPDLLDEAADLAPAGLRSLDAIHLASALRLGPRLTALVGYDRRLTEAATALGLPVAAPV